MRGTNRRETLRLLGAAALGACAASVVAPLGRAGEARPRHACRVRTITAGVPLPAGADARSLEQPLAMLARARARFESEGYEVQTLRITTPAIVAATPARDRRALADALVEMDAHAAQHGVRIGIGPLLTDDRLDEGLPDWAAELVSRARLMNCSIAVATPDGGAMPKAAETAARTMQAIARVGSGGLANFRFAAAANVPPGTPFFPVGYHAGAASLGIGLEGAGVIGAAAAGAADSAGALAAVRAALGEVCRDVERIAAAIAAEERVRYGGIDPSPAPGMDRSIGAALEALIGAPFGAGGTLEACAAITGVLKTLEVRTCGYAGLMLPVPEDPRLAQRESEGRFGLNDLLLYSSVCGTGLDCIPLAADTPLESLTRIIRDTAALAAKWRKALSVRAMLVPGKHAGELVSFDDPLLTACRVLPVP
jgi:uncharacterized protein (UPF0210 family)